MTVGKWCKIRGYKRVDFDWVVKRKIIGYDSFLIDDIHEDKKVRHDFQLFIRVLMVDIVPIVVKELEQGSEKLKQDSACWEAVDLGWKWGELPDRWVKRVKCLLDDLFAKVTLSNILHRSVILRISLIIVDIWLVIRISIVRIVNILSLIKIIWLLSWIIYTIILRISLIDCDIGLSKIAYCIVLRILIQRGRSIITICGIITIKVVTSRISCICRVSLILSLVICRLGTVHICIVCCRIRVVDNLCLVVCWCVVIDIGVIWCYRLIAFFSA